MSQPSEHAPALALVAGLAAAIRGELGDQVEACPGHRSPEQAEPLNRVFRAVVRHLLESLTPPGGDLTAEVRRGLHHAARDRLGTGGLDEFQVRTLLELEPGTPDDWPVFLILVPRHEVLYWLGPGEEGPA
jgi:hypothetical protein